MADQLRLVKPSKRQATFNWRRAVEIVSALELQEGKEAALLKATRASLKTAHANLADAGAELAMVLDSEDPTLPGTEEDAPTVPT